jgi:hypothetical protein
MRCGCETDVGVVAARVDICGALACVAFASVNWQIKDSSLASSNLAGKVRQEKITYERY